MGLKAWNKQRGLAWCVTAPHRQAAPCDRALQVLKLFARLSFGVKKVKSD